MSDALAPGTEIASYRIHRLLGRGGMGLVYLAEHVQLERKVALKTISGAYAEDPQFRDRFVRESRMAAQIDHANIVPIYDAGEAQGLLYLAMRLVQGEDLEQLIRRDAPADDAAGMLDVLAQVASALDAAHAEGLVHRDVKPANILLEPLGTDGAWHAYLADFGLTKHADADTGLTRTGQVMGTPSYVAPEQIDQSALNGRADQYSLACILFECLTGSCPFDHDGPLLGILHAHANEPRPQVTDHRPDLPSEIDAVVARGLAIEPDERFETCAELVDSARAALQADDGAGQRAAAQVAAGPTAPPAAGEPSPAEESVDATLPHREPPATSSPESASPVVGLRRRGGRMAAALLGVAVVAGVVAVAAIMRSSETEQDAVSDAEEQAEATEEELDATEEEPPTEPTAGTSPEDLVPEAFPMPADVTDAASLSDDDDSVHAQFEVDSSYAQTTQFFESELPARDWEVRSRREAGNTTRYRIEGHGWTGAITVFGGQEPVEFLVQLGTVDDE